ncbi:MAG: serine--tRNA ligase, partial [Candidatus Atribacteria bacterium]|nr:serine--tRNA ligase [Candidatus Atribacteria bacterium]
MLDIKLIRSNPEKVKEALKKRKEKINIEEVLSLDEKRRELLLEAGVLKETRNTVSEEIGKLKREKKDAQEKILAMKEVSAKIKELDAQIKEIEEETTKILLEIPNIPHESVPVGEGEKDNTEIRKWGEPRKFDFTPL